MPPPRRTVAEFQHVGEDDNQGLGEGLAGGIRSVGSSWPSADDYPDDGPDEPVTPPPELPAFSEAPEAEILAGIVIREFAPELLELDILYVWDGADRKRRGKIQLGETRKLGAFDRWLAGGLSGPEDGASFAVVVNLRQWQAHNSDRWRKGLLAHHLAAIFKHVDAHGNESWRLRDPDLNEFSSVVEKYGLWSSPLHVAGATILQLPLPLREAAPEPQAVTDAVPE